MATRSIFVCRDVYPYFEEVAVNLCWFGGFALSQKRKCEIGLHKNFNAVYNNKCLEISGASLNPLGCKLSAMSLKKETKLGITSVESAFQSSRVYYDGDEKIGAFHEFLFNDGKECKRKVKERSRGLISHVYDFDGMLFPAPDFHISLFYDYLYINALCEDANASVRERLISGGYTAFSDLATKALNSQARACAVFVSLYNLGLLDRVRDFESYMKLFRVDCDKWVNTGKVSGVAGCYDNVQLLTKKGITLLSAEVPCVFGEADVINYYEKYYSHLSNSKHDKYTRLGIYDVDLSEIRSVHELYLNDNLVGYRVEGLNGCVDFPVDMVDTEKSYPRIYLSKVDDKLLSEYECKKHIIYPYVGELNMDVVEKIRGRI